jgi:ABC-type branched-subunit amino acid transport system substrate-binding protein
MVANLRAFPLAAAALAGVMVLADRPALAADEIMIGAPLPLTGALSPEGEKLKMGYELWLEEVEKRGGISVGGLKHKVRLVYSDYQSQTPKAVQLAEKLISSRQGPLPVLAIRVGRDQGRKLRGREVRRPDDGLDRVVERGL